MLANYDETRHVLVGQSPRARQVLKMIEKLGRCRWPALLLGETGTGKEVVVAPIHNISPHGPFVTIDCSSMVGPLMESELFGHVKGAFTGAATTKIGLIEAANGGTALFDEIGELPSGPAGQAAPSVAGKGIPPGRFAHHPALGFSDHRRHQSRSGQGSGERDVPPRSVLPSQRHQHPPVAAAGAQGGHSGTDQSLPDARRRKLHRHRGSDGGDALLRLAGQRARTRKLYPAHGRHQFRTAAACRPICLRTSRTT